MVNPPKKKTESIVMPHTLAISGAGVRGYAYPFALEHLINKKIIDWLKIDCFVGTSAGAITATYCACGAHPPQLKTLMDVDFSLFQDDKAGSIRDIYNILVHRYYCEGVALKEWIRDTIGDLTGNPDITFEQLFTQTGKTLKIPATNKNKCRMEIFSPFTTPDVELWKATLASSSLPFFYQSVKIGNDYYSDGGLCANLYDPVGTGGELALQVVSPDDNTRMEINSLKDELSSLIATVMNNQERNISKSLKNNTISIHTGNVKTTDFNLSSSQKRMLQTNAIEAVNSWVEG